MDFGWWHRDDEKKKWQIAVRFHGGNVTFSRKGGHHASWEDFEPTDDDWTRLIGEAERRVPRRLMSPKQFDDLKSCRPE